jgi:hypothetical protein
MARRTRVHSRDIQPQVATPKGLLAAARVQRFDWPATYPTTAIDELGRKLHVGTTSETPQVTVTMEAFDTSHVTFAYLTGYTGATFPVSGASITELKGVDVIGQIRDASTLDIVNALYVPRGTVTAMDATFGVRANSTIAYTVTANSKKELKQPVFYESFTIVTESGVQTLSHTPTYLPRTSGYLLDAYRTGTDGSTAFLDESINGGPGDYTVTGANVNFNGNSTRTGDIIWVTYVSPVTTEVFKPLNNQDVAAVQGKYVPTVISLSTIPRVQAATIRVAFNAEVIEEMGSMGKPVGYEVGVPSVTGDLTVLKTDNDLVNLLNGQSIASVETDLAFAVNNLPLKIQLKDPRDISKTLVTYYVPSITVTSESDTDTVNAAMNETFAWESTTGELIVMSGAGVY